MAKKATKRRTWTADHVRTLKMLARKKKHASRIAKTLNRTEGRNAAKSVQYGIIARLACLNFLTNKSKAKLSI